VENEQVVVPGMYPTEQDSNLESRMQNGSVVAGRATRDYTENINPIKCSIFDDGRALYRIDNPHDTSPTTSHLCMVSVHETNASIAALLPARGVSFLLRPCGARCCW
jgi:hypothetical protein